MTTPPTLPRARLPHHKLLAYEVAIELLIAVQDASIKDPKLRDQALRAAKSVLADEPQIATYLKSVPVHGKATALDLVHAWIAAGTALGKLEFKREAEEVKEATKPIGKAAMNALRGRWIREISLTLANLEQSEADPRTIEMIRAPVLKASARAGKRYEGAPAVPPPAPVPVNSVPPPN